MRARRLSAALLGLVLAGASLPVQAAELKVACSQALRGAMGRLGPDFERASGDKLIVTFGTTGGLRQRIADGRPTDVVILTGPALDELDKEGSLAPGSQAGIARSSIGVAVKSGTPKPDIGSVEALKRALLAAKSIAYSDPAKGGASGIHFAKVLETLGIAEAVRDKTRLASGSVGALAASGEAELAIQMLSELQPVAGIDMVGPLPDAVQERTLFSGAVLAKSGEADAGRRFLAFLASDKAAPTLTAAGLEPVK